MDAKRPGYPLFPAFTPALVGGSHTTEAVGACVSLRRLYVFQTWWYVPRCGSVSKTTHWYSVVVSCRSAYVAALGDARAFAFSARIVARLMT
jgi:hypothetical protein